MAIQSSRQKEKNQQNATSYKPAFKQAGKNHVRGNIVNFVAKEVDMMPAQWQEPGNPTPYELSTTIATCKRLWKLNKDALQYPECDIEITQQNIKTLERMYIHLMDYLVE